MKQLLQSLATGSTELADLPSPSVGRGQLLIRTSCSLVSSGTERMLVEFGKANWIDKGRQHPEKIQQVIEKARTDGVFAALESVQSKLDKPLPVGYCNVGTVISVGPGVTGFSVGDRVASNGPHAELVVVSQHLCAVIPPSVNDEAAAFTVLASIGLQGIRLSNPTLGETFVVSGLGLIGLLTGQLLAANGCRVFGFDPDPSKCALAEKLGITSLHLGSGVYPVAWCLEKTNGVGVDGVLITAATPSSEPLHLAAQCCRKRGRIVLVGVTGLDLRRELFYKKELSFRVSCSYGPGRYDPTYEENSQDYPIGFVRWTVQRNFQAVLNSLQTGKLDVEALISHRFKIERAPEAYDLLSGPKPCLGILLYYSELAEVHQRVIDLPANPGSFTPSQPLLDVIGAGNYSSRVLIPAFAKAGADLNTLSASSGVGPVHFGRKFAFRHASTDISSLLNDSVANTVVIATRHDSHADLVQQALRSGKHVFVEKPLCLTSQELSAIEAAYSGNSLLMVGFNRRFAPLLLDLQKLLSGMQGPKSFVYTCNAGFIPHDHWTQDPLVGGGRLIGEACHFVDLLIHLASSSIDDLQLISAADRKTCPDTFTVQLRFVDGSIGSVHYFSNGSKTFPKERLEVFGAGKVLQLDNFRALRAWGFSGFRTRRLFKQDKGHVACCESFLRAINTGSSSPIPPSEIFEVQRRLLEVLKK